MTKYKLDKLALVVTVMALPTLSMTGCVTVKDYYQEYFGMDKSTREVTGYYEHVDSKIYRNTLVVPEGLDNPGVNSELTIPQVDAKSLHGPLGEAVDVRPPTAPYRSDMGIHTQWSDGEAIVWFERNGSHGIQTEDDAWMLLASVLKHMNIGVGKIAPGQYLLTTISRDFTEFGKPYDGSDAEVGLKKYNQIYQIRVGRNSDGSLGIASKLIGSMTSLSSGKGMEDLLDMIEQERFAMDFANNIIHEIDSKQHEAVVDPDNLVVSIGKDHNNHQAIIVEAPFETTTAILEGLFDRCGWKVTKHSVSKAEYDVEVNDNTDNWVNVRGRRLLDINTGKYKIRVGIHQKQYSAITFYNEKDTPIPDKEISRLYPGFADVLVEEFKTYSGAQSVKVEAN